MNEIEKLTQALDALHQVSLLLRIGSGETDREKIRIHDRLISLQMDVHARLKKLQKKATP